MPALNFVFDHPSLVLDSESLHDYLLTICVREGYNIQELNIVFTGHAAVRSLNQQYLNHDYDTDVIAFQFSPSLESKKIDGEIYINLDMALERCQEFEVSFEEEASRYTIHGLLHLMNYDDKDPDLKSVMKDKENEYLKGLFKS